MDHGYSLGVIYKGEFSRVLKGGARVDNSFLQNLDVRLLIDAEKAFGLKNTTFFVYGLGDWGSSSGKTPTTHVGDEQGTSNIETPADKFSLYEAWAEYKIPAASMSVLVGIHDLNSEFYVTDSAAVFLNSSFGVGREFSQTGDMGPSIFPYTSPALRVHFDGPESVYFKTAAFGAKSGDPNAPKESRFRFNSEDGFLTVTEFGRAKTGKLSSKIALGQWQYTKTFDHSSETVTDSNGNTVSRQVASNGFYALFNQSLTEKTSVFIRFGSASTGSNAVESNLSGGVLFVGPLNARPDDKLGLGCTSVAPSDHNQIRETTYELTYRAELGHGIALQPDLQIVTAPSFSHTTPDALAGAVRLEIGF